LHSSSLSSFFCSSEPYNDKSEKLKEQYQVDLAAWEKKHEEGKSSAKKVRKTGATPPS
jgi:hypothetical protein